MTVLKIFGFEICNFKHCSWDISERHSQLLLVLDTSRRDPAYKMTYLLAFQQRMFTLRKPDSTQKFIILFALDSYLLLL